MWHYGLGALDWVITMIFIYQLYLSDRRQVQQFQTNSSSVLCVCPFLSYWFSVFSIIYSCDIWGLVRLDWWKFVYDLSLVMSAKSNNCVPIVKLLIVWLLSVRFMSCMGLRGGMDGAHLSILHCRVELVSIGTVYIFLPRVWVKQAGWLGFCYKIILIPSVTIYCAELLFWGWHSKQRSQEVWMIVLVLVMQYQSL